MHFFEQVKLKGNQDLKPKITHSQQEKAEETERLMGKKKVHRIHFKVACMRQFTCLWSSPQFCTRNREGVQKRDKEEKGI